MVSWWSCWLPMVEKSVVALVDGWNDKEREGEKRDGRKKNREVAGFWPTLDPIFFSLML